MTDKRRVYTESVVLEGGTKSSQSKHGTAVLSVKATDGFRDIFTRCESSIASASSVPVSLRNNGLLPMMVDAQ